VSIALLLSAYRHPLIVRHYYNLFRRQFYANFEATFNLALLGGGTGVYRSPVPPTWNDSWRDSASLHKLFAERRRMHGRHDRHDSTFDGRKEIYIRSDLHRKQWTVRWLSASLKMALPDHDSVAWERLSGVGTDGLKGENPHSSVEGSVPGLQDPPPQHPTDAENVYHALVDFVSSRIASRGGTNIWGSTYFAKCPSSDENLDAFMKEFCRNNVGALLDLKRGTRVTMESLSAWGGVQVLTLTPDMACRLDLNPETKGAVVSGLDPEGPAAKAGLRAGDVIVEINFKPVTGAKDVVLANIMGSMFGYYSLRVRRGDGHGDREVGVPSGRGRYLGV
jgi:PDZ domain